MFGEFEQSLPEHWQGLFRVVTLPVTWLFPFQELLFRSVWTSDIAALTFLKRFFLILPAISLIVGLWVTMLGIYTLIFRENRYLFITTILICWFDIARCTLEFWAGVGRFVFVAGGSIAGFLKLLVAIVLEVIREMVELPFVLTGTITANFKQAGIPWLAVIMTVTWAAVEALIFTYVLTPLFAEVLSDLVGTEEHRFLSVFLYIVLFGMILGSFACMHSLVSAIKDRAFKQIIQMALVEFFVMFVEVLFLYRELIDALTPWIAQQTGVQMGIVPVIMLASFMWFGLRGMSWFLFAKYGTPTLVSIIAREALPDENAIQTHEVRSDGRWVNIIGKLKRDQDWFESRAQALVEAITLPAFHILAAGLNFAVVMFMNKTLFKLPFKSIREVGDTEALIRKATALTTVSSYQSSNGVSAPPPSRTTPL